MTPLTTRARELAARERKLYDETTIPAVLEELADEADKLRVEAANSAAQRDEAEKRAEVAEERLRAVEADLAFVSEWAAHWIGVIANANEARAELARIRAADRTSITVRTTEAAKMRKGQAI